MTGASWIMQLTAALGSLGFGALAALPFRAIRARTEGFEKFLTDCFAVCAAGALFLLSAHVCAQGQLTFYCALCFLSGLWIAEKLADRLLAALKGTAFWRALEKLRENTVNKLRVLLSSARRKFAGFSDKLHVVTGKLRKMFTSFPLARKKEKEADDRPSGDTNFVSGDLRKTAKSSRHGTKPRNKRPRNTGLKTGEGRFNRALPRKDDRRVPSSSQRNRRQAEKRIFAFPRGKATP